MFVRITFSGNQNGVQPTEYRVRSGVVMHTTDAGRLEMVFGGKNEQRYEYDPHTCLWAMPGTRVGWPLVEIVACSQR